MIDIDIREADAVVNDPRWLPRWGWHDDHLAVDGTPAYLPAVQQSREEFLSLARCLSHLGLVGGAALQLGIGPCIASHELWRCLFKEVVSVDVTYTPTTASPTLVSGSTHDENVRSLVEFHAPYDFLFIDAGHTYDDVKQDHEMYAPMVRAGGVVAFHDARTRKGFTDLELGVPRYLAEMPFDLEYFDHGVGTAYYVKGV